MGNTNIYINKYLADNERFADLINGFLFGGKQWVHAENLSELNTTIRKSENETGTESEEIIRDQLKCWNHNGKLYILGVEAEQNIQYAMSVRIMNYDAGQYNHEYKKRKKHHRKKKDLSPKSYVAGISKDEHLYPVLSMVLYLGNKQWDAPNQLSELCGLQDESDDFRKDIVPLYNDYHVHVLDVNTLENPDVFRTDLCEVLGFLAYRKDADILHEFVQAHEGFQHLRPDAYRVIAELTNIAEPYIKTETMDEKEGINMCEAVEKWLADAKEEGVQEERARNEVIQQKDRTLFQRLVQQERYTDLNRALTEDAFREQLILEYGI